MKRTVLPLIVTLCVLPALLLTYVFLRVTGEFRGTFAPEEHAECAIVFGAAVHSRSDPGPAITRRVRAGVTLLHEGRVDRLIFTGGKGSEFQASEAEVMRDLAIQAFNVATGSILLETSSSSTWENIVFTRPLLLECASLVAISDRYHLARINLIARRQGIDLETYPATFPDSFSFFELRSIFRDMLGYAYYLIL